MKGRPIFTNSTDDSKRMTAWTNLVKMVPTKVLRDLTEHENPTPEKK